MKDRLVFYAALAVLSFPLLVVSMGYGFYLLILFALFAAFFSKHIFFKKSK